MARQIIEFAERVDKDKVHINEQQMEWMDRFTPRINALLARLDEAGQYSEKLQRLNIQPLQPGGTASLRDAANEINRMADGLPETESQ